MKIVLTPFYRRLVIQLGIAFGTVLVIGLAVFFLNAHINTQVTTIADLRRELAVRNRTIELLAGGNSDLARAEPLMKNLESVLPQKESLLAFSRDIKKYGAQFNLTVGFSFGIEKAGSDSEPGTVSFTLTAAGEYENLVEFLAFLEKHPYFIRFDGISLSYVKEGQYTMTTSGLIYTK